MWVFLRFDEICAIGWRVISVGGRGGETMGRSSKRSVTAGAGRDHRSGPSAGAAGSRDRLGVSGSTLCHGSPPFPHTGTAERGHQTPRAVPYVAGIGGRL